MKTMMSTEKTAITRRVSRKKQEREMLIIVVIEFDFLSIVSIFMITILLVTRETAFHTTTAATIGE